MDAGTKRALSAIILMFVAVLVAGMVVAVDVPPRKKRHLLLDAAGCAAVRGAGLIPQKEDAATCELTETVALTSNWLTVGTMRINTARVIAVREVK